MDAHEELADLGKLANEGRISGDELLNRFIVAKISKVTKDRHEALGLERETVNIQFYGLRSVRRSVEDTFVGDLIREEIDDDVEQTCDEIMISNDMTCDRWDSKELEGKILYGRFRFPIDKEIGIHNARVHSGKMTP